MILFVGQFNSEVTLWMKEFRIIIMYTMLALHNSYLLKFKTEFKEFGDGG